MLSSQLILTAAAISHHRGWHLWHLLCASVCFLGSLNSFFSICWRRTAAKRNVRQFASDVVRIKMISSRVPSEDGIGAVSEYFAVANERKLISTTMIASSERWNINIYLYAYSNLDFYFSHVKITSNSKVFFRCPAPHKGKKMKCGYFSLNSESQTRARKMKKIKMENKIRIDKFEMRNTRCGRSNDMPCQTEAIKKKIITIPVKARVLARCALCLIAATVLFAFDFLFFLVLSHREVEFSLAVSFFRVRASIFQTNYKKSFVIRSRRSARSPNGSFIAEIEEKADSIDEIEFLFFSELFFTTSAYSP